MQAQAAESPATPENSAAFWREEFKDSLSRRAYPDPAGAHPYRRISIAGAARYFRFFKADGETVKEISFDGALSLPAAS